jgi:hypothetical protein
LRTSALVPARSTTPEGLPFPYLPDTLVDALGRYADPVPVIVGHYWCEGSPELFDPLVACVDYSVAKNGPLVAYRWSGETVLTTDHYVAFLVVHPNADDNDELDTD